MYLNYLMTDRELIDTAQYAENPHLRLLAERLDDKMVIIRDARTMIQNQRKKDNVVHMKPNEIADFFDNLEKTLER